MSSEKNQPKCCPTDFVIHTLASRWTIAIIKQLATGPKRPSQLSRALERISAKTLTQRLREMEDVGLLERKAYQEIPPRVVYSLTSRGSDLLFILEALQELGESWQRSLSYFSNSTETETCAHCFERIGPEIPELEEKLATLDRSNDDLNGDESVDSNSASSEGKEQEPELIDSMSDQELSNTVSKQRIGESITAQKSSMV